MLRSLLFLLAASISLSACADKTPLLAPVQAVGTDTTPALGDTQPPDAIAKQLASLGVQSAGAIAETVQQAASLAGAYYDAKGKYTRYRILSGPEGWEFRRGWYQRTTNTADATLRAQFEDASGAGAPFDVTFDVNYGPDMHPTFPVNLTQLRVELDRALPSGRLAATLLAPLPASRLDRIDATGSGLVSAPDPVGNAGLEALNASFFPAATPEPGVLVLKSLSGSATYQFSGRYKATGLDGTAQVLRNGAVVGEVVNVDGTWQLRNKSGSYPLQ